MLKTKINEFLTNKSIVILGFGREGKSTLKYILDNKINYTRLAIADRNESLEKIKGIEYFLGENYFDSLKEFDVIIKAPGVSLKDIDITDIKEKVTSQAELFIKYGKEKIIGITGTKGKSTTTSMIYHALKSKYNVEIVGNIGIPPLDYVDKFEETEYFVYELSSHQLELLDVSPKIAVFLNLYEEHLDYYSGFEAYANAKRKIYQNQTEQDIVIYNKDMEKELFGNILPKSKKIGICQKEAQEEKSNIYENIIKSTNILGKHNIYNLTVAITVAKLLGIEEEAILNSMLEFKALPHRLENIRKI